MAEAVAVLVAEPSSKTEPSSTSVMGALGGGRKGRDESILSYHIPDSFSSLFLYLVLFAELLHFDFSICLHFLLIAEPSHSNASIFILRPYLVYLEELLHLEPFPSLRLYFFRFAVLHPWSISLH